MNEFARKTSLLARRPLLAVLACLAIPPVQAAQSTSTAARPGVEITRWGRQLLIQYRAARPGSRMRLPPQKEMPPRFAVYRNGQEIGSGSFRYG